MLNLFDAYEETNIESTLLYALTHLAFMTVMIHDLNSINPTHR